MQNRELCISIIVPVYNVEPYIRRCLDSIVNQSYKNLEVILIDDGSTDRSGKICDEYACNDSRMRVIHKKHSGLVSTRKIGIQCATGEYVTDVDSDDWIEKDAFSYIAEKLNQYNPDMLVLGYKKEFINGFVEEYKQIFKEGWYQGEKFIEEFNKSIEKTILSNPIDVVFWNKVMKREIRKEYQLIAPEMVQNGEDDVVTIPCLLNINSMYIDSHSFYHYCVRENSIVWSSNSFECFLMIAEHLIKAYSNSKNRSKINDMFLKNHLIYIYILDCMEKVFMSDKCLIYPQIRQGTNVIVYGKGVFSTRLIKRANELQYCNVIDVIDKTDCNRITQIDENKYDYIVVAVLKAEIVSSAINLLFKMGIKKEKILCLKKEDLTINLFPNEVKEMWSVL